MNNNIKMIYDKADEIDISEGKMAYFNYNKMLSIIANEYDFPLGCVVASFCALSPNNDYVGNLRSLITVLDGLNENIPNDQIIVSTYNHCRDRAIKYLNGEPFVTKSRGLKTLSFYHNIMYPESPDYITIDGHMMAVYTGEHDKTVKEHIVKSRKQYFEVAECFSCFARKENLLPNQLQSILWFARKRIYKIKYSPNFDMFSAQNDRWGIFAPLQCLVPYR